MRLLLQPLDAARPDRRARRPGQAEGRALPARGRPPDGGSGGQEGAPADHLQRRDPRLVRPAARRQPVRHPGLREGRVVHRRQDRHLPRPVQPDLRQGTRLHADRGRWRRAPTTTPSGWPTRRRRCRKPEPVAEAAAAPAAAPAADPNKKWTADELKAAGEKLYAATCAACHQPTGKGMPPAFPPLAGSKVATGPKAAHIALVLKGKTGTAMASFARALRRRSRRDHHLRRAPPGATRAAK